MKHIDPATWTQLIVAVSTLLIALAGWIKSISNGKKADDNSKKIDANTVVTQQTHDATNGKMEQLVQVVKSASFAAGQKDQVDKQTAADAAKVDS